jgi:hypothetical protein
MLEVLVYFEQGRGILGMGMSMRCAGAVEVVAVRRGIVKAEWAEEVRGMDIDYSKTTNCQEQTVRKLGLFL